MSTGLLLSLQIAATGMGIVFLAIILIWILISGLTSLGAIRKPSPNLKSGLEDKQKAAALAVAIALSNQPDDQPRVSPMPPTAIVSAWQLSLRTNQMKQGGRTQK
jgi:hypothetical protein